MKEITFNYEFKDSDSNEERFHRRIEALLQIRKIFIKRCGSDRIMPEPEVQVVECKENGLGSFVKVKISYPSEWLIQ